MFVIFFVLQMKYIYIYIYTQWLGRKFRLVESIVFYIDTITRINNAKGKILESLKLKGLF